MATVTQSLFGIDPEALMAERDRQARAQALQVAQLDPLQQARYTSSLATNQLGNAVGGLLGVQDPELMRVRQRQQMLQGLDITNPVALRAAAQKALEANDFAAAQELAGRAAAVEKQQAELVSEQALTAQRLRTEEKTDKSPLGKLLDERSRLDPVKDKEAYDAYTNQINKERQQSFGVDREAVSAEMFDKPFAQLTPTEKATVNRRVEQETRANNAARAVKVDITQGGPFGLSDINPTLTNIRAELGPVSSGISEATQGLTMLDLDNPKADAQVDRALATLSGDKQLSMAEVQAVANAGSFGQRVSDSVNKFFTGQTATLSKEQKRELLEVLAAAKVSSYNKRRNELLTAYNLTQAPKESIEALVGPEKSLPEASLKKLVERTGAKFEPSKYTYRIGPNGQVQRKPKGK